MKIYKHIFLDNCVVSMLSIVQHFQFGIVILFVLSDSNNSVPFLLFFDERALFDGCRRALISFVYTH